MFLKTGITGILLVMLLVRAQPARAQELISPVDTVQPVIDTGYCEDYTYKLTARAFLLFQNASLLINAENINKIVYRPNVNLRVGLAGFWKWFGLGLSIDNPFYKTDKGKYGNTSTTDIRINAFGRSIVAELFMQRYRGFYIGSPVKADDTYYMLPDMKTFSLGISAYWIYNPKRFSIRAAFIQTERQKRSAGSLLVWPSFLYFRLSSETGIIPAEIMDAYNIPATSQLTNGDFYSVGLAPGYAYTFVFLKDFYLTGAVFPGVAAHYATFRNDLQSKNDFEFTFQLGGRFAVGYNSDKWFIGGSVQTGFNEIPDRLSNVMFNYNLTQFRFWGGTRFDIFRKKKK
jgi:hypothetical protein